MFNKSIAILKSLSIFLSILFLLLVASYVLSTRIALHFLPEYRAELVQFLSQSTNQPVDFTSINSSWDGFDAVLQVNDFSLGSEAPFKVKTISFYFSFIQSLISLQPKFDRILIEGSEISVKQTYQGDWEFLNFSSNDIYAESDSDKIDLDDRYLFLLSLFNGSTINIKNLSAVISNEKGKVRTLRLPTLNVNYSNDALFASGKVLQKLGDKTLLNFSLRGSGLHPSESLKGVLFVEARSSEFFGELLGVYDWQKISLQDIEGSSRAWINFDGTEISSVYGDLQVSEINWRVAEKSLPPIHNLAFSYLWQNSDSGKQVIIDNFGFEWSGKQCEPIDLFVDINELKINVLADKLNVKCVNDLALSVDILPEKLKSRLSVSEPSGYLTNIDLSIIRKTSSENNTVNPELTTLLTSDQASSFTFEALLNQINIKAYESTPSGKNLSGYVYADDDSGYVSFLSENFELGFPTLFLDPWELKRAEGMVSWEISNADVSIYSNGLRLWREDNSLIYGDFALNLNSPEHEDYLSLAIGLQDVFFQDAVKFVPYYVVNNDLYKWLSNSLVAGSVNKGIYYGYGVVETASPENSFTSSIYLHSDNGAIQFEPSWPYLEDLEAEVVIQNGQLDISAKQALIAGTTLNNLKAIMPESVKGTANFLNITADTELTSQLVDYWLKESPIANNTKNIVDQLSINTTAHTNIFLKIPVSEGENSEEKQDIQFTVNTAVMNGEILHKPSKLLFKDLTGMVSVDSKNGVNAQKIKTKLFNETAILNIKTVFPNKQSTVRSPTTLASLPKTSLKSDVSFAGKLPEQLTKLTLQGDLAISSLFEYFETAQPTALNGSLKYLAELSLSDQKNKYPLLNIKSDLFGVSCLCPAPFSKNIHEKEDLNLSILLKPDQTYLDGVLKSKHMPSLKAELLLNQDSLSFGEILIDGAKVKDTNVKGLNIAANIKLANLENWINFLKEALKKDHEDKPNSKDDSFLKQVQLSIDDLDGFGHLFQASNLLIKPTENHWLIDILGKDAKGQVLLPRNADAIIIDFERLNLVSLDKILESSQGSITNTSEIIDPKSFPEITFSAKKLMLENKTIGSWKFDVVPDENGSIFRNIEGHIKGTNISGQLNWRSSKLDSSKNIQSTKYIQSTIATFDILGDDISAVFNAFDLPVLMTSKKYNSEIALHWPDSPLDFSMAALSGKVSLSLEDGFLKTEDQKTGVLRLFGVLNAESIKRRLKLDFSDLYKSGVGFDTFLTKASIDQGLMTLTEPMVIDGPAGKYVLNGRSDLSTKAIDFDMLVELPFAQNVPLAALVLGAPQIGGLVWVADKLLGEPLSALTTSRYDITGTWEQPTINLKQVINASKKDRSKERGTRDARQK